MKLKTVFHVFFKSTKRHKYYGGMTAIFEDQSTPDIGLSQSRMYHYDFAKPFENDHVVIRKGELITVTKARTTKPRKVRVKVAKAA
jgi:hypothetical protein